MKKSQIFFWLLLFVTFCLFSQNNPSPSFLKSKLVNEEGIIQFASFKETSKLNAANGSNFLIEFLEVSKQTTFVKVDSKTDKIGLLHETFQQYHNNIPVEFGIYKVHLKNGNLTAINGDYFQIKDINNTPTISEIDAVSIANRKIKADQFFDTSINTLDYTRPNPTLVIFPKMKNINDFDRLAYKLDIYSEKPLYHSDVYVDAHTGEIIFESSKIHQINVGASGTTLYNGTQNFRAEQISSGYRLRQSVSGNGIQTFDGTNGVQNATDIISSTTNFNTNAAAVQVHWGTERTHQYFLQKHNRNSFDGNGALIKSYLIPQSAVANAYWTGSVLYYSMGNGSNAGPLTALDIVGHEFTHGVVDYSADLIYSNQSGAVNESFADIFGEMIEHYAQGNNDWLCGASVFNGGIRSMSNPKSKGHPDTYLGQYWQTTEDDNFGVHTNSGVQNKWFYLLAVGGIGTNDNGFSYSVNGIGIEKAAQIAYRTLTLYLTPSSNYHYVAEASTYAARELFGPNSPEHIAAGKAWKAVGLLMQPTDYIPPTTPLNLVVSNATANNAILTWDASTDNVGVLGYNIYMNESLIDVSTATIDTINEYMPYNTIYNFKVQAFDAAGNISGESNIESVWFDTIGPTAPTNLTSSNTTQTTTDLSWNASTDNFGVAAYEIYQNPGNILLSTVTDTTYTVTGLTDNSNYSFYIKAIDTAGNESSISNTEYVTTPMQCTGGNGNLTLTINFSNTNTLNSYFYYWEITDTATSTVVAQEYYFLPPGNTTLMEYITLGPGTYFFDFFDYSSPGAIQDFELIGSSQVIIPSTVLNSGMYIQPSPFCVDASVNRTASTPNKLINNNTKLKGEIYPNPVIDILRFKNPINESRPFFVFDITGKVIIKGVLDSENSIDVSQLQSGLYILGIINGVETKQYKFIKK